jgi:hypothetical protein
MYHHLLVAQVALVGQEVVVQLPRYLHQWHLKVEVEVGQKLPQW